MAYLITLIKCSVHWHALMKKVTVWLWSSIIETDWFWLTTFDSCSDRRQFGKDRQSIDNQLAIIYVSKQSSDSHRWQGLISVVSRRPPLKKEICSTFQSVNENISNFWSGIEVRAKTSSSCLGFGPKYLTFPGSTEIC